MHRTDGPRSPTMCCLWMRASMRERGAERPVMALLPPAHVRRRLLVAAVQRPGCWLAVRPFDDLVLAGESISVVMRPGGEGAGRAAQHLLHLLGKPCVTALCDQSGAVDGNLSEGGIDARGEHLLPIDL
jgi:hypothetical protein